MAMNPMLGRTKNHLKHTDKGIHFIDLYSKLVGKSTAVPYKCCKTIKYPLTPPWDDGRYIFVYLPILQLVYHKNSTIFTLGKKILPSGKLT